MTPASTPTPVPGPDNHKADRWTTRRWVLVPTAAVLLLLLALVLMTQIRRRNNPTSPTPTVALSTPAATIAPSQPAAVTPAKLTYIVMPGDTLASIAEWFNVPAEAIMNANNLTSSDEVYPGQLLTIPSSPQPTVTPSPSLSALWDQNSHRLKTGREGGGYPQNQQSIIQSYLEAQ